MTSRAPYGAYGTCGARTPSTVTATCGPRHAATSTHRLRHTARVLSPNVRRVVSSATATRATRGGIRDERGATRGSVCVRMLSPNDCSYSRSSSATSTSNRDENTLASLHPMPFTPAPRRSRVSS